MEHLRLIGAAPPAPSWLLPLATERWNEIAPLLAEVLTRLDLEALAKYCQCYAQYRMAQAWMAEHGMTMTVRNDKGEVKIIAPVPHVGIASKMLAEMRHYEKAFGLTPAARSARLEDLAGTLSDEELAQLAAYDPGAGEGRIGEAEGSQAG